MNNLNLENYKIYVDYALYGKIGIFSNNPYLRISIKPEQKIKWQIEGEALAIKHGVLEFLKNIIILPNKEIKLIIYTDNKCLLRPFNSKTQAGGWWWEAQELASRRIKLEIRFVRGVNNPADRLTRSKERKAQLVQRDKNYYYQRWLKRTQNGRQFSQSKKI